MRDVIAELERAGAAITMRDAPCEDSGQAIASEAGRAGRYDVVVATGGDGTIRSVAAGLRGTDTPVGILPLGTGNVMAHELGVARTPASIGRYLLDGAAVPVVATLANGRPFFLMAGAGLDAEAVAHLDMRAKRWIGKLAYVWPVVRAIFRRSPTIRAVLDGETHLARWVVVCSAGSYAGSFRLSPDSHLLKPGLTAMLCSARGPFSLILNIVMIGAGLAERAPHLRFVHFRRAHLSADLPVRVQLDGESFGELPLSISEDHSSVLILIPEHTAAALADAQAHAAA